MGKGYYSIKEFCEYTTLSRSTVWRHIEKGRIRTVKIGKRVLIPCDWKVEEGKGVTN